MIDGESALVIDDENGCSTGVVGVLSLLRQGTFTSTDDNEVRRQVRDIIWQGTSIDVRIKGVEGQRLVTVRFVIVVSNGAIASGNSGQMSRIDRAVTGTDVDDSLTRCRRGGVKATDLPLVASRNGDNCAFGNNSGSKDAESTLGPSRGFT